MVEPTLAISMPRPMSAINSRRLCCDTDILQCKGGSEQASRRCQGIASLKTASLYSSFRPTSQQNRDAGVRFAIDRVESGPLLPTKPEANVDIAPGQAIEPIRQSQFD